MTKRRRSPFATPAAVLAVVAGGALLHVPAVRAESTTSAPAEDTASAKAHFKSGKAYYDLGKYDEAIREFEAAYEAKSDPAFLFNLAQAHRLAGHPTEALHFYRTYLRYVPDPPNLADIQANMRALEKVAATRPPTEVTTPPPVTAGVGVGVGPGANEPVPAAPEAPPAAARTSPPEPRTVVPSSPPLPPAVNAPPVLPPEESPAVVAPVAGAGSPSPTPTGTIGGDAAVAANATSGRPAEVDPSARRRLGKVLTVVGGSTMLVGAFFGLGARAESKSVESAKVFDPAVEKRGQAFESLQWVGYILGGITTGVGVYLLATNKETPDSSPVALVPLASPHVGGAMLRVSFR